jgi:hypothetical protein
MYEIQVCYTEEKNVKECRFLHTVQASLQITIIGKALEIAYQHTFVYDDLQL